jgi:hypothetical protein
MLNPKPEPMPTSFVVKKGSNMLSTTFGEMPLPVSVMSTPEQNCANRRSNSAPFCRIWPE